MTADDWVRLHKRGEVARLLIHRPEKRNAMTEAMWLRLQQLIREAIRQSARVIVVEGVPGSFASGADIGEFAVNKADEAAARRSFAAVDDALALLAEAPVPTIAAVDGYAVGAGLSLVVACDLRVVTQTSRLGITAARLGVTVGHAHVRRLVWTVGPARAKELLLTARLLAAEEAVAWGLASHLVADGQDLVACVERLCAELVGLAPQSLRWAKEAVRRVTEDPALAAIGDDAGRSVAAFATAEFREGLRAFQERRPPRFGVEATSDPQTSDQGADDTGRR